MPRKGENIYKRKDGRWEGRYVKGRDGKKAIYGYPEFSFLYTSPYLCHDGDFQRCECGDLVQYAVPL